MRRGFFPHGRKYLMKAKVGKWELSSYKSALKKYIFDYHFKKCFVDEEKKRGYIWWMR